MNFEKFFFNASFYGIIITLIISLAAIIRGRPRSSGSNSAAESNPVSTNLKTTFDNLSVLDKISLILTLLSFIFISISIIIRTIKIGHGPFTSMYEFSIGFVWGILLMSLYFSWKYQNIVLNFAGVLTAGILLFYANTLSAEASNLVPALQNSLLLSLHVASAVIAYGAFTIGFIAAILFLLQRNNRFSVIPDGKSLEKISYHSVIIGFPFMTLVIVLGAIWADIAWGTYWSWDPKETASLVTWLIYAAYLHTRITRGWKGRKSALLLIIGFIAVIFTFFGNYIFNGLHAYI